MASIRQWLSVSSWARVVPGIKDAFIRFPLPFISVTVASLVALLALHEIRFASRDVIARLLVGLGYGSVALTSLRLVVDSRHWSLARHAIAAVVVMAVVAGYAWLIFDRMSFSVSVYFASALILSLLFAPYINSRSDQASVWYFNYQTGVAVFFAGLATLVLAAGIFIILSSLRYLFDVKFPSTIYGDVWILGWGMLFPVYILANISRQFDYEAETCSFPKGIRFITNYILLPLMVVYMAILYAYFARITINWELPRGKLTWMIAVFGTVGIVTKLLAYPIRNSGTRLLAWFDRYYYYALIVPIILLAVAIGVRIRDYGVTEQRYTIVLMAVWFSSIVLLAIFRRDRFHIRYVPMILSVLLLLGTFGPWSAAEVSIRSQVSRFEAILSDHQLLRDGVAVKAGTDIPFAERKRLSSIADYLCANEERFRRVRPWFRTLMLDAGKKDTLPCIGMGGSGLVKLMGIHYVNRWQQKPQLEQFDFNYQIFQLNRDFLDVSGYDYVAHGTLYQFDNKSYEHKFKLHQKADDATVVLKRSGDRLTVSTEAGDTAAFDIGGIIRELRKHNTSTLNQADRKQMSISAISASGRFKAHLILEQVQGTVSANQELNITYIQYVVMLKFNET